MEAVIGQREKTYCSYQTEGKTYCTKYMHLKMINSSEITLVHVCKAYSCICVNI